MNFSPYLDPAQIAQIMQLAGASTLQEVELVSQQNLVYRIRADERDFFLKAYTKDWYSDDVAATGYCVEHECSAWAVLATHGLAVPEVALARTGCDNPLGRPFLLTRGLPGESLTSLLAKADAASFTRLLETTGDYLRRMHAISFAAPGYIIGDGPTDPPDPNAWQHAIWSAQATQRWALAMLEQDHDRLSPALVERLASIFATIDTALASAFVLPRFTHGDCHANSFFLLPTDDGWAVTGMIDMEVASAGDAVSDLVKMSVELASVFPATARWWEPLFYGYGKEPDFDQFRLRLLGYDQATLRAHGVDSWRGSREQVLISILNAANWAELLGGRSQ